MVIWFIGLSGSGKTFFANKIYNILKKKKKVIHIDGDEVRKYINYNLGYSLDDRKKNSLLISDLCNFLEKKNYIVICSILSICRNHQKKNRKKYDNYIQIYIKSELKDIILNNNRNIYSRNKVVGKDIYFPTPYKSDLVIKNKFKDDYKKSILKIIKLINDKNKK